MIRINPQLKQGVSYKSHREMFPRLYWQNFDGKWEKIKKISIELVDGHWEVQTDSTDTQWIAREVEKFLAKEKELNEKRVADAMTRIIAIKEVI